MPRVKTNRATASGGVNASTGANRFPTPQERAENLRRALTEAGIGVPHPSVIPNGYAGVGAANAEGVITHGVYSARGTFNTDGTGIRIGVLSDGADSVAASQATGDLPPTCSSPILPPANEHCVNVVDNAEGGDEGTAMMEVIHDLAPGAQLYFATAFTSPESFAQNIRDLRNIYACDIIVDDVGYSNESGAARRLNFEWRSHHTSGERCRCRWRSLFFFRLKLRQQERRNQRHMGRRLRERRSLHCSASADLKRTPIHRLTEF